MGLIETAFLAWGLIAFAEPHPFAVSPVVEVTMPRNPDRPMTAATCEEARARLQEAERGSPLISRQQNQQTVRRARAQVKRVCGQRE